MIKKGDGKVGDGKKSKSEVEMKEEDAMGKKGEENEIEIQITRKVRKFEEDLTEKDRIEKLKMREENQSNKELIRVMEETQIEKKGEMQ